MESGDTPAGSPARSAPPVVGQMRRIYGALAQEGVEEHESVEDPEREFAIVWTLERLAADQAVGRCAAAAFHRSVRWSVRVLSHAERYAVDSGKPDSVCHQFTGRRLHGQWGAGVSPQHAHGSLYLTWAPPEPSLVTSKQ
jgi:hypothetical protein